MTKGPGAVSARPNRHYLRLRQPAEFFRRHLCHIQQDCIRAADGDERRIAEKHPRLEMDAFSTKDGSDGNHPVH